MSNLIVVGAGQAEEGVTMVKLNVVAVIASGKPVPEKYQFLPLVEELLKLVNDPTKDEYEMLVSDGMITINMNGTPNYTYTYNGQNLTATTNMIVINTLNNKSMTYLHWP